MVFIERHNIQHTYLDSYIVFIQTRSDHCMAFHTPLKTINVLN